MQRPWPSSRLSLMPRRGHAPIGSAASSIRRALTAIRTNLGAIFVSLELSRSTWLITSLSPGGGEKMSKHSVSAGDIAALLARFSELMKKAFARTGGSFPIIVIQEAGLDGFWVHRLLHSEGIESNVVDPASIASSRRRRRAKTDKIDGEALVRALLAYKRGEPRVCAMARAPTPEEERSSCSPSARARASARDPGEDVYHCPGGETLTWRYSGVEEGLKLHCYWTTKCTACALKSQCTPATEQRVKRWEHEAVLDAMQERLDRALKTMRIRRQTAEHPFGTISLDGRDPLPPAHP